jgi:hypothetical protein
MNPMLLNAAIDALAGSLAVIAGVAKLVSDLWPAMVRQGWVNLGGWVPDHVIETLQKGTDQGGT